LKKENDGYIIMIMNFIQILILSISGIVSILWTLPFILSSIFGYSLNYINDTEKINKLLIDFKKKSYYSHCDENKKPLGWFISFSELYIGYIQLFKNYRGSDKKIIWVFCMDHSRDILYRNNNNKEVVKTNSLLKILFPYNSYWDRRYKMKELSLKIESYNYQEKIINNIISIYKEKGFLTSYLYGKPGIGKSCISYLLTKKLNSVLCNTFDPSEPGTTLDKLYSEAERTDGSPLIVVIDECDRLINKIHNENIVLHKDIPTSVRDKQTFNNFLDQIDIGLYYNMILLLISNKSREEIHREYDDYSYLRDGRIHYCVEVKK
jgi:hypothetical protein